jgi:glucosamine--fructose-6-phosphate aminotransferase (isomerizing)
MCWIFAYNGRQNPIPLLVEWLRNLEYRGYDSAGVFAVAADGHFFLEKAVGKVSNLATRVEKNTTRNDAYITGIAHTRWATHGGVTEANCHPHRSSADRFFVVHNGIIENYRELKAGLIEKGYVFYSETDTEVVAKLLEDMYDGDILSTFERVLPCLVGAYALAVVDREQPDTLIGAKLGSPMIVGISESGTFLSSDINAVSRVATEFVMLEDREIIRIEWGVYSVFALGQQIEKDREQITAEFQTATIGAFETFTEKEISEIPEVLHNALKWRVNLDTGEIRSETLDALADQTIDRIEIIASGSSYFAGVVGSYWFRELAHLPCDVRISSEFLYDTFLPSRTTLYVFMSQSGETADVRESLRMVKEKGCLTFGIVNVVGSTIARMTDMGLYTHAGVEVGVASTKNIVAQLAVLLTMALSLGLRRELQSKDARDIVRHLRELPAKLEEQLADAKKLNPLIEKYSKYNNFFYLGRNLLYGTAAECSLKLKELTYLHAECYSAGELKHGPLALVNPAMPTIVLNLEWVMTEKTASNIKEVKARNGVVLWVVTIGDTMDDLYDDRIEVPTSHPLLSPFLPLIPMWLFAVGIAKKLGNDVDKPQNLAKSVTVE